MTKRINLNSGASIGRGAGLDPMTSAGNPWTLADGLAYELVNRQVATLVDAEPQSQQAVTLTASQAASLASSVAAIEVTPATETYGGIMDAVAKVIANGGGIVRLKPTGYDITSAGQALPVVSNLAYEGAGYLTNTGNNLSGGTIVYSTSKAFNIFEANATDAGSDPVDLTSLRSVVVYNFGLRNLGIKGGLNGLKVGALHKGGAYNSSIDTVQIDDCAQYGDWLENWAYGKITELKVKASAGQAGCSWIGASTSTALYNHGNMRIAGIFGEGGDARTRGLIFMARGGNTSLNDLNVNKLQRNCLGVKVTVSAAMVNTSADITVADATVFPVDLEVTVNTSANGFSAFRTYFVVYSSGTTVRVADFMGGTPLAANNNAAISLITWGYPALEIIGYGAAADGNILQPSSFALGVDTEGVGTNMITTQNGSINLEIGTAFYSQTNQASTLVARQMSGWFSSTGPIIPDFDNNSASSFLSKGYTLANNAGEVVPQAYPQGMVRGTKSGYQGLQLGIGTNNPAPLAAVNSSGEAWMNPGHPIGQRQVMPITATPTNLIGTHLGALAYTGTVNGVFNLPTLTGSTSGAANGYIGAGYEISNASTTPGVTLTVNVASPAGVAQPFNRQAGKTSVVLAVGQSFAIRGCTNAGADWFWQVTGNNGVTI